MEGRAGGRGPGGRGGGGEGNTKEPVRSDIAPKKISHIQFGLLSANEMEKASEFRVRGDCTCCFRL